MGALAELGGNVVRLPHRPRQKPMPERTPELAILTAILAQMEPSKRCTIAWMLGAQHERTGHEEFAKARNYVLGLCGGEA